MADNPLDRIHIADLQARCIIGINDDERVNEQDVYVNITLHAELAAACKSDHIDDTVDYKTIKKRVYEMVKESNYFLVERLADEVAAICLEDARVQRADVRIDKPGALRFARSVAVEISRSR